VEVIQEQEAVVVVEVATIVESRDICLVNVRRTAAAEEEEDVVAMEAAVVEEEGAVAGASSVARSDTSPVNVQVKVEVVMTAAVAVEEDFVAEVVEAVTVHVTIVEGLGICRVNVRRVVVVAEEAETAGDVEEAVVT